MLNKEVSFKGVSNALLERCAISYQKMAADDARIALNSLDSLDLEARVTWQRFSANAGAWSRAYLFELIDRKAAK